MADKRHAFILPAIPARKMLAVLAAISGERLIPELIAYDMRLHVSADNRTAQLIFPEKSPKTALKPAREKEIRGLCAAHVAEIGGAPSGRAVDQTSGSHVDFDRLHDVVDALPALCLLASAPSAEARQKRTQDRDVAVVYPWGSPPKELEAAMSKDIKSGRDAELIMTAGGNEASGQVITFITDQTDRNSIYAAPVMAHGAEHAIQALTRRPAASINFWLPYQSELDQSLIDSAGRIAIALQAAGRLAPTHTDAFYFYRPMGIRALYIGAETERVSDADLAVEVLDGQPVKVTTIEVTEHQDALDQLTKKLTASDFNFGYRVRLADTEASQGRALDVSQIEEQIEELTDELKLLKALDHAKQQHLLRFSDAQLPAMVDGLRHFSREALKSGLFKYAASHSAGTSGPSHYLLYDQTHRALDQLIAEHFWRVRTEDRPIRYWLDPFVAQAVAGTEEKSSWRVFVPMGKMLLPGLRHFSGNVDDALKTIIGTQFPQDLDLPSGDDKPLLFLMSDSPEPDVDMEIEILDKDQFGDLKTELRWINDYLTVKSPRRVAREDLARLADDLYAGELAETVKTEATARVAENRATWRADTAQIARDAAATLNRLGDEIDTAATSVGQAFEFLAAARSRIDALMTAIEATYVALNEGENAIDALPRTAADITAVREDFEDLVRFEFETSRQVLKSTERKLEEIDEKIRSVRRWGARE